VLLSPVAPSERAAEEQQLRWEGGKFHLARVYIPTLLGRAVTRRKLALVDTAVELAVPPLGYHAAAAAAATTAGVLLVVTSVIDGWAVIPAAVSAVALPFYVLIGMYAAEAPSSSYRALIGAPALVLAKVRKAHRLLEFRPESWVRTERRGD